MAGMEVKMVNWEEGNYRVTDTPRPRGELVIGGASVARGYFKNEEKTAEDFFNEGGDRRSQCCSRVLQERGEDCGGFLQRGRQEVVPHWRHWGDVRGRDGEDHRPEEGPCQAAARRVRQPGQGGGAVENASARREHLRLRRLLSVLHRGSDGADQRRSGKARNGSREDLLGLQQALRGQRYHPGRGKDAGNTWNQVKPGKV